MKTDKMDEKATVVPTVWSQLRTPVFQSGSRLVVAMNGSFYYGLSQSQVHIRTMFEDMVVMVIADPEQWREMMPMPTQDMRI